MGQKYLVCILAIERHAEQFLWGIDRGDAVWNYDIDVGQAQVKLARTFIGRLDPTVQENVAYKNAQGLLGRHPGRHPS